VTRGLSILFFAGAAGVAAQNLSRPPVNTDQRIAIIERSLKQAPADSSLRNELAGAYLQKMRETADGAYLDRASRIVNSILQAEPGNYDARRRQIEIEMQRHHFQQVISLAGTLTRERPADAVLFGLLGDAGMETGDYDHAADAYQTMVDLRPNLASYNRVAFYQFVTGDPEGALDTMRRAIRAGAAEPENVAWCEADLGRMLLKTGANDEAEQAFRRALTLFPRYHPALAGLGRAAAARGQFAEATRLLLQAQAAAPFPEYTGLLAKLYRKMGRPDLANRQIALLDMNDQLDRAAGETANRNLSLALSDLRHRPERALELARAELKIRQDVYTYDAVAWALFQNGQLADAATAIDRALARNSPEPIFHDHAFRIFEALGRTQDAQRHREKARSDYWQ
jgi:tetratricopeptide (TPR) repeat protein